MTAAPVRRNQRWTLEHQVLKRKIGDKMLETDVFLFQIHLRLHLIKCKPVMSGATVNQL